MIEYLLKLQVKDENNIRVINNHICKSMRENYKEAGKVLEILEYSMTEVR